MAKGPFEPVRRAERLLTQQFDDALRKLHTTIDLAMDALEHDNFGEFSFCARRWKTARCKPNCPATLSLPGEPAGGSCLGYGEVVSHPLEKPLRLAGSLVRP